METKIQLKVGDEVYVSRSTTWNMQYTKGKVVKITPSGKIDVLIGASTETTRFRSDGRQEGYTNFHSPYYLEEDTKRVSEIVKQRNAVKLKQNALEEFKRFVEKAHINNIAEIENRLAELKDKMGQ